MINATSSVDQTPSRMTPREDDSLLLADPHSSSSSTTSSKHGSREKLGPPSEELEVATVGPPAASVGEMEDEEWSKLRCGSLCTEELARKEKQREERRNRQNRCADYPGFAFGSAMFGSDTTMKFNIIKNELHNIMRSQLKRVDGEVNALSSRIKEFDQKLEQSEKLIREATSALAEAVALQIEDSKNKSEEDEKESNLSAFDQHVLFLEAQLREARVKASQSFQILEDCNQEQINLLANANINVEPTAAAALRTPANPAVGSPLNGGGPAGQISPKFPEISKRRELRKPLSTQPPNKPCDNRQQSGGDSPALPADNNNLNIIHQKRESPTNTQPPRLSNVTDSSSQNSSSPASCNGQLCEANNNNISPTTAGRGNLCEDDINANIAGPV